MARDKNGNGERRGGAGVVFGVSNDVVAIIGGVAIIGIGAHLVNSLLRPKQRAFDIEHKTDEPTLMEAMYGEITASASHPEQVHSNQDRVQAAIKQRIPRMQHLAQKAKDGVIGPDKVAEGIHNNARDVLEQLEIPSQPHPTSAPPALVELFKNQRKEHLTNRYNVPGGLILDPYERRWLEKEAMSYQATTDPVDRVARRDAARDAAEAARLARIREAHADRQQYIAARYMEEQQDRLQRRNMRAYQGLNLPRLGIA